MSDPPATVEDVTTTTQPVTRVRTRNHVNLTACCEDHGQRLLLITRNSDPDARLMTRDITPRDMCAHCALCGTLVVRVEACVRHDSCPVWEPLLTEHARRAVPQLLAMVKKPELTPRGWAYLEEAAANLAVAGKLTGPALAEALYGLRVDIWG